MHQVLLQLERGGLVTRSRDPQQGRILRTGLTDQGQRVLRAAHQAVGEIERRMLAGLTPPDVGVLRTALDHITQTLNTLPVPTARPTVASDS